MKQQDKFGIHLEKRSAVAALILKLEMTVLPSVPEEKVELKSLRNELLHLRALKEEVVTAIRILLEADVVIVNSQRKALDLYNADDFYGALKEQGRGDVAEVWTRLSLAWKIFLYSVRCYQDCIYKAILLAQFQAAGPESSMAKCISKGKWTESGGVGKLVISKIPKYPDWFIRARSIRNKLKKGLAVQSVWSQNEHFIVLKEQQWNGHMIDTVEEYPLKFEFAIETLEMCISSISLIKIAFDEAQDCKEARRQRLEGHQGNNLKHNS